MARIMLSFVLGVAAPAHSSMSQAEATSPAARIGTTCVTDAAWCHPANLFDLVPPGTHCLELLPYAMQAGIAPADSQWYLNTSWGESHCRPTAHNPQLREGTWGPMQISYGSWKHLCGLSSGADLFDPTTTFRCALAIETAAGRRQWAPHSTITGLFPGQT